MVPAMSLTGSWLNDAVLSDVLDDPLAEDDVCLLSLSEGAASNDGSMVDAMLVLWLCSMVGSMLP